MKEHIIAPANTLCKAKVHLLLNRLIVQALSNSEFSRNLFSNYGSSTLGTLVVFRTTGNCVHKNRLLANVHLDVYIARIIFQTTIRDLLLSISRKEILTGAK